MNRYEKIAWFNLAIAGLSVVLYVILFLFLRTRYDVFLSAQVATSAFALIALTAFGPLMFKKSGAIIDEQGTVIRQKYRVYKYILFWAVYISIFFGIWIWAKVAGTISDQVKVLIVFMYVSIPAFIVFTFYRYLKKQKESKLINDEQNLSDVFLYGPDMDERDLKIHRTARWSGFGAFWVIYVFGLIGTWGWLNYMGYRSISIEVSILPLFVFGAFILIYIVDSITTVILYRRGQ